MRIKYLAMLHDVELPQPGLIKGVTGGVNNMAQAILLCQDEHRVEETLHGFRRMNKTRPKDISSVGVRDK